MKTLKKKVSVSMHRMQKESWPFCFSFEFKSLERAHTVIFDLIFHRKQYFAAIVDLNLSMEELFIRKIKNRRMI